MNVLVVAPHADDEVLGCGGTIARHRADGDIVSVAIMTDASVGAPELYSSEQIANIRNEAKSAHEILDVNETRFFDFPAPRLETSPSYKIAAALTELIQELRIETLYIPHQGDLHRDHGVIHNAALVAAKPRPGGCVKSIFAYETLSETEYVPPLSGAAFAPNHYVEIGPHIEAKIEAMKCFGSQLKEFPDSRSIEGIEALARFRGVSVGLEAAEAFSCLRTINPL